MTNPLSQIIGDQKLDKETLPYTGESYSPSNTSNVQAAGATTTPEKDLYAKYRDPKTGEVMSPEDYAIYLGNKVPKGGDVNTYAGDALTNPDQTSNELTSSATKLNNARNDIAVGETDPYKVANKSGIAYTPAQLKAIESAYAGVYDPALEDVFTRLRDKKTEDDKAEARDLIKFKTNEDIRKYNATTAANKSNDTTSPLGILRGEDGYVNWEQYEAKAKIAEDSGILMQDFVKNYPPDNYINPKDKKKLPAYLQPEEDFMSKSEKIDYVWRQMGNENFKNATDEQKAGYITELGLDPNIFLTNYYGI